MLRERRGGSVPVADARTTPARLLIVARPHADLYEYLHARFSDDANVTVILDRRLAPRRRRPVPAAAERRRAERRCQGGGDEQPQAPAPPVVAAPAAAAAPPAGPPGAPPHPRTP